MSELGSGSGSSYPGALDTNATPEVDSPNAGKTKARADVPNDHSAAIIATQTELGTDPAGTLADVKTYLQTEHNADGTHDDTLVAMLAGVQTVTGVKTFSGITEFDANVIWAKGADLASAATLPIGADGNYFDVTGTTTITAFSSIGVGTIIGLHFDEVLILTHDASNLVLPGGNNITTVAGDEFLFVEYAAGDWRMISGSSNNSSSSLLTLTTAAPSTPATDTLYSDTIVKGWVNFVGTGTVTINDDVNVSSITDNGAGDYTVVWETDFSDANYCAVVSVELSGTNVMFTINGLAAGTTGIFIVRRTDGVAVDVDIACVMAVGAQ